MICIHLVVCTHVDSTLHQRRHDNITCRLDCGISIKAPWPMELIEFHSPARDVVVPPLTTCQYCLLGLAPQCLQIQKYKSYGWLSYTQRYYCVLQVGCPDRDIGNGRWHLNWLVTPRVYKREAGMQLTVNPTCQQKQATIASRLAVDALGVSFERNRLLHHHYTKLAAFTLIMCKSITRGYDEVIFSIHPHPLQFLLANCCMPSSPLYALGHTLTLCA